MVSLFLKYLISRLLISYKQYRWLKKLFSLLVTNISNSTFQFQNDLKNFLQFNQQMEHENLTF